jgi:hypothetical protein
MPPASDALVWSFAVLAVLVAGAVVAALAWVTRREGRPPAEWRRLAARGALLAAGWLALTGGAAAAGALRFEGRPPTIPLLLLASAALGAGLAGGPLGARLAAGLPLPVLVGSQAFRIPVELLLDRAFREGLAPAALTYHGRNFDVVTGATALLLAALLASRRLARRRAYLAILGWNVLGSVLLLNVVAVAVLSAPGPLHLIDTTPPNVWIAHAPWVWLPTVMVVAAGAAHAVVFRRLAGRPGRDRARGADGW